MTNDSASTTFLHPSTFSCEIHLHLCDNLKCPCVYINLLLVHLQKTQSERFDHLLSHVQTGIKEKKDFSLSLFTQHLIHRMEYGF